MTLWYVGVLALVLLAFSAGVYTLLTRSLNERLDGSLQAAAQSTASSLTRELTEGLAEAPEIAEAEEVPLAQVEAYVEQEALLGTVEEFSFPNEALAIFDAQGRLLAEKATPDNLHAALPPFDVLPDQPVRLFTPSDNQQYDAGLRGAAVRVSARTKGAPYLIVVTQSLKTNAEELTLLRRIFYIAAPLTLLLAALGGFFLARKALAPVEAMSTRAQRINAENLKERLPVANPRDELGRLAAAFNDLLERLNNAFDQQRQFMADASHELRTPLSVMHTTAEVTLEQPRRLESEYREALALMDAQVSRLTRIVEDMFTLARADAGRYPLQPSQFYLDELIDETAQAARMLAARKNVSVEVVAAETPFQGDEELLRQMLLNLLNNAIKYTPTGGTIRVGLAPNHSTYEISVADSGTGIPDNAQPHIFERFYRADKARTRTEANGGSGVGLGLSIARWIVEAHNGQLELRRSDASGSLFVASLPNNSH